MSSHHLRIVISTNPGDICYIFPPSDGSGRFGGGGSEDTGMVIEGGPQDPMEREPVVQERNDCLVFAGVVDILAQEATTDLAFVLTLCQRFKDRNLSFLASGFRPQFVDTGSSLIRLVMLPEQLQQVIWGVSQQFLGDQLPTLWHSNPLCALSTNASTNLTPTL